MPRTKKIPADPLLPIPPTEPDSPPVNENAYMDVDSNRVGPGHEDYNVIGAYWSKEGRPSTLVFRNQRYIVIRDAHIVFIKQGGTLGMSSSYGDVSL